MTITPILSPNGTRKPCYHRENRSGAQCCCKFQYVSNFTI